MLLDKYRLIRKLAMGGMAEIYLARQEGMEGFRKDVVIKRILPIHADNDELTEMFLDEARIAATLSHPNIVQIIELGKDNGDYFIAMEYVHGQDLRRTCERGLAVGNSLPLRHAVRVIADAAAGLHYAHTQVDGSGDALNIVHRDISPQNIVVSFDGVVKVLDFGIAKAENKIAHTRTGQVKGKYAYMSPEQCDGGDVDARSDIFSLGILLYEITLWRRLFQGETEAQTIKQVSEAQVQAPSEIQPEYPPALEDIVMQALARDPDDRFQSAREMQVALEDFLSDNRMKTGPVQLGEYMKEIFPDKLERPGEDPVFMAEFGGGFGPKSDDSDPLGLSLSDLANPSGGAPAVSRGGPAGGPPRGGPPGRPGGPPGRPGGPPGRPGGPPGRPGGPPGRRPPGPPGGPKGKPPAKEKEPEDKWAGKRKATTGRKRISSSSARVASGSTEYRLQSEGPEEVDSYEQGSRIYYGALGLVVIVMLAGSAYLIYDKGALFASKDAFSTEMDGDPDVAQGPPPPPLVMSQVSLTTKPGGARVVVNGILREGDTPDKFDVIDGSTNTVSFYAPDHEPKHVMFSVAKGAQADPVKAELAKLVPPAAEKTDDDDAKGKGKKGKGKKGKGKKGKDDAEADPAAELPRGKLTVRSEPEGAEVFLDGESVGMTPVTINKVTGFVEHHITVRKKGFYDHVATRVTFPDVENPLDLVKLIPEDTNSAKYRTELKIETIPREAQIKINGEPVGGSPMFKAVERNQVLRVLISAPDYEPYERMIATSTASIHLNPQLKKIVRTPGQLSLKIVPEVEMLFVGKEQLDTVDKLELPAGAHKVMLVRKDGTRGEVTVDIVAGQLSEYTIDFKGAKPVLK